MTTTREDFEKHFRPTIRQQKRHTTGDYRDPDIQAKWVGWQAGRAATIEEAARLCEEAELLFGIDVWMQSTKQEISARTGRALADKVRGLKLR